MNSANASPNCPKTVASWRIARKASAVISLPACCADTDLKTSPTCVADSYRPGSMTSNFADASARLFPANLCCIVLFLLLRQIYLKELKHRLLALILCGKLGKQGS